MSIIIIIIETLKGRRGTANLASALVLVNNNYYNYAREFRVRYVSL